MKYLAAFTLTTSFFLFHFVAAGPHVPVSRVRRIINGEITEISKFPHQVEIVKDAEHLCGGSIISNEWILTAAHCIESGSEKDFTILTGSTHIYKGKQHRVKKMVIHEDFVLETRKNDIAVIKVETPIEFNENTQPIKMIEPLVELDNDTRVIVTGWGYTEKYFGTVSERLRKASIYVVDNEECRQIYEYVYDVPKTLLCATDFDIETGSCHGDSGGPLITEKDNMLVGVVSGGKKCGNTYYPALYTKVSHYREWIKNIAGV